ncbi:MAG TPA: cytochrome C oxidase subunit IV family protein [Bdellovibrionales bacterium]|nr:cytochrome C oxidase subunit IV family protein [Bdellovibrionales bacterium]
MAADTKHHIIPMKTYLQVISILMVLTVITVVAAQVDFGAFNTIIAMAIASVKAGFVLAIFMHLKYDDRLFTVCFATSIFFLVLMFFLSWVDIYTRIDQTGIL